MLRTVQWALGNVGRAAIQAIHSHPDLELVGARVYAEEKVGRDIGTLSGLAPLGIDAGGSLDHVLALKPDCVVYAPMLPDTDDMIAMLRAGINIVTPLGWFYPERIDTFELEKAARRGGATLHGTGLHPGGMTEQLPLVLSAYSRAITHVRIEEFSDCRAYGAPEVLRDIMLFGATPEVAQTSPMKDFLGIGFAQSIHMMADALGFAIEPEVRTTQKLALATSTIEAPFGPIEAGCVAAQHFAWEGIQDGVAVLSARVNWFMGREGYACDWDLEGRDRYEIEITGDPPVRTIIHGIHPDPGVAMEELRKRNPGIVATAVHCVSAVPYVCDAVEGIATYRDLPMMWGRAGKA